MRRRSFYWKGKYWNIDHYKRESWFGFQRKQPEVWYRLCFSSCCVRKHIEKRPHDLRSASSVALENSASNRRKFNNVVPISKTWSTGSTIFFCFAKEKLQTSYIVQWEVLIPAPFYTSKECFPFTSISNSTTAYLRKTSNLKDRFNSLFLDSGTKSGKKRRNWQKKMI